MLLSAGNNLATTGALSSTAGSVGLVAVGSIAQSANITAGGDVLFEAGGNITQTAVVTSAGGNLQATSTTGTLSIGELSADHVSLTAGVDILDVNGENVRNIRAASLAMVAGGIIGGPDVLNAADANANAIDIEVGTLAARSGRGIYLQELAGGGDLIVDDVSGSASVTVNQVRFNSTTSLVAAGDPLGVDLRPLEDLETGDGPIKLVVRNGSLTINDGLPADGVGVSAGGVQDVLLWASGNLTTNAGVTSGGGHVTLQAGGNLTTNANLSTLLSGDVYLLSGNDLAVNAPVSNVSGSMLLSAGNNLATTGALSSTAGSVGLVAVGSIAQSANITAGGDVLFEAGGNITQTAVVTSAGGNLQATSTTGTLSIGELSADHVSLTAGVDILDVNGENVRNIRAASLAMLAGGIIGGPDVLNAADANANAIDIEVGTLAARSGRGIYLQELAGGGDLIVDDVSGSASVTVNQVRFNSTTSLVAAGDPLGVDLRPLEDLETGDGPIKLVVRNGSLTINDGLPADGVGVSAGGAGDVLLNSTANLTINAGVSSGSGHVSLLGGAVTDLNASVFTTGSGSIYVTGQSIDIDASINAVNGDILLVANDTIRTTATISSASGSLGLIAESGDVLQIANTSAGSDFLVEAGRDYTQTNASSSAVGTAQVIAGGTIRLSSVSSNHASFTAGQNILDNSASEDANIRAQTLAMFAGGIIGGPDTLNALDANANAIDISVNTLAVRSVNGIYLQQQAVGGNLVVDHVEGSAAVRVQQVRFNSTTNVVEAGDPLGVNLRPLDDIESINGPVKLIVRGGSLTVNDGADLDGDGVQVAGAGDILLAASSDVMLNVDVESGTGNIEIRAGRDVESSATVRTGGDGTVYVNGARDQRLTGDVISLDGDILLEVGRDLVHAGAIGTQNGDVGLFVGRNLTHTGSLLTSADVIVRVGAQADLAAGSIAAGERILVQSGITVTTGGQLLGVLQAQHISLDAAGEILDGNGAALNVTATDLRVVANSLGTEGNPLELNIERLAAQTTAGIYIQRVANGTDLTIGHVAGIAGQVVVQQVNFNSSLTPVTRDLQLSGLSDLQTVRSQVGGQTAIDVVVESGNLIVTDGNDADGRGIVVTETGSIELRTTGVGSIAIQTGIETRGLGNAGRVVLDSAGWIAELARDASGTVSDARIVGDRLEISADGFAHLHNVLVNSLTANVNASGVLDGAWQQTNSRANDRGDDFLDQLGGERQASATAEGVIVNNDPGAANSLVSSIRESYADVARQFRFEDTYQRNYSLFVQNHQTLDVQNVTARDGGAVAARPNVYIETVGVGANLNVSGTVHTHSSTSTEGGIVLVAGGQLNMNGTLATSSELSPGVVRTQRIEHIGNLSTTDALGRAAVGYLNGRAFNGGEGVSPQNPLLTSTQFVIRDQLFGLSALSEDYRSHVFQRVVMQYGFAGEEGFVTFVGYADGEIQQFDTLGEAGARSLTFDDTNASVQSALPAVLNGSAMATAFSRATSFDPLFLDANQVLPTAAVARRAADFFMFENVGAADGTEIRDLTVESFEVKNVFTLGTQGATEMPRDPAPIQPPMIQLAAPPELLSNPTQLVSVDIELAAIQERITEVAIYRVYYEDANTNGVAEESELPSEDEILTAEVAAEDEEQEQAGEMKRGKRLKLETVKTQAGGSPTAEDIEALKNEYLNDPERPSGAYSIIEKGLDDKEVVLDVFSVRDSMPDTTSSEVPLIRLPTAEELLQQQKRDSSDGDGTDIVPTPGADEARYQPHDGLIESLDSEEWNSTRTASRFEHAGLVASSLWLARAQTKNKKWNAQIGVELTDLIKADDGQSTIDFSRRGRRSRRQERRKKK